MRRSLVNAHLKIAMVVFAILILDVHLAVFVVLIVDVYFPMNSYKTRETMQKDEPLDTAENIKKGNSSIRNMERIFTLALLGRGYCYTTGAIRQASPIGTEYFESETSFQERHNGDLLRPWISGNKWSIRTFQ
jgi:hypothetical protein